MITKVISGMQTGADQGGLYGAKDAGISTGGTAPQSYYTEIGPDKKTAELFGLTECRVFGYPARTKINVADSDGTLIIGNIASPGCRLTKRLAAELGKPCYSVVYPRNQQISVDEVAAWLDLYSIQVLNVAGNRESTNRGIFKFTRSFIKELCEYSKVNHG